MTNSIDIVDDATRQEIKDEVLKAVALKHERGQGQAPHIVASGKGRVAEQILELAFANGVKVRKDTDLTELLTTLDLDTPIPLEAYAAVAEILAYVYQANSKANTRKVPHEQ